MAEKNEGNTFLNEIKEDIRHERLLRLGRRYLIYGIALGVTVLLGAVSIVSWNYWQDVRNSEVTSRLLDALTLQQSENANAAAESFAQIAADLGGDKVIMAKLFEAGMRMRSGDLEGAIKALNTVIADKTISFTYRHFAILLSVLYELEQEDPVLLETRLTPLLTETHPWRYTALELQAILAKRQNDIERAIAILTQLQEAPDAPDSLKARAEIIIRFFEHPLGQSDERMRSDETDTPTSEQPSDETDMPTNEQPSDKPETPTNEQPSDKPEMPMNEQPSDKPEMPMNEQPSDETDTPTNEQPSDKPEMPMNEQPSDKPETPTNEQPSDETDTPTNEQPSDKPEMPTNEQPSDETDTPTNEQPSDETDTPTNEQPSDEPETGE